MASVNKTKIIKRDNAVMKRKIHPINTNWLLNNKDGGYGSNLCLSGRPQTGVNAKHVGNSKTTTVDGKLQNIRKINPIKENLFVSNKVGGNRSEFYLRGPPQTGGGNSKAKIGSDKLPHISTRKIRERLIHMLGFHSYTKIELYSILQREGIRSLESKVIPIVLREIAQVCKGAYSLRLGIWREVDETWPYYTEKQLLQVKIRKERSLKPPKTTEEVNSVTSSSLTSTTRTSPSQHENKPLKIENASKRPNAPPDECQPSKKRRTDYATEPPNYDFSEYTEIINLEQRHQYKVAFDRYYEEYMPLWQQNDDLKCSFRALVAQILDIPVDHPEYERIQQRIVDKFKRINSEDELKRNHRCDYLHAKLDHIKHFITIYDRKRTEEAALAFAMTIANQYRQQQHQLEATPDDKDKLATTKFNKIPTMEDDEAIKATGITDIITNDLALSDSDSDEEMIAIPKSHEIPTKKDDEAAKASMETQPTKYECIHDILTNDLALSDSDSDEEMIAIPKSHEIPTKKDNEAAKASMETPPTKHDCILDILTNDLALSDSDSDED